MLFKRNAAAVHNFPATWLPSDKLARFKLASHVMDQISVTNTAWFFAAVLGIEALVLGWPA